MLLLHILLVVTGLLNDTLKGFLETQGIPKIKDGKKAKFTLGVSDPKLGGDIKVSLTICIKRKKKERRANDSSKNLYMKMGNLCGMKSGQAPNSL